MNTSLEKSEIEILVASNSRKKEWYLCHFKFILQIIIPFICRNLPPLENLRPVPETSLVKFERKLASFHHTYIYTSTCRSSREQFSPAFVVRENASATSKTFDPVARLSPWNFEGEGGRWGPQENNSWRLTVTDRGENWFTGVFLPGKIPPRRDTTLRWPGRGMRLIRPPRVLLPQKITAAHPPPLILEITFPGIPPPALFFPMVAGYFSGGQRSRDTRSLFIRSIVDEWTWCTTLGKSDFDVYVNDNDNVSKNRKIFVFAYVWFKFGREA